MVFKVCSVSKKVSILGKKFIFGKKGSVLEKRFSFGKKFSFWYAGCKLSSCGLIYPFHQGPLKSHWDPFEMLDRNDACCFLLSSDLCIGNMCSGTLK